MVSKEDFEKLEKDPVIGSTVKEMHEIWEKLGCPNSDHDGPTTEIHGFEPGYWTEYEREDEIYAAHYNSLIDSLLGLIDIRNISNPENPILYCQAYRDSKFGMWKNEENDSLEDGYEEAALKIIGEAKDSIYEQVCSLEEKELLDMGYEYSKEE